MKPFPKKLSHFYFQNAVRPFAWILGGWFVLFMLSQIGYGVLYPFVDKWFIGLFEQTIIPGDTLWSFAGPTLLLIFGVITFLTWVTVLGQVLSSRWYIKIYNHLAQVLNDYVNSQSLAFYTERMSGKINSQINYIANGFHTIENLCRILGAAVVIILNTGLVFTMINMWVAVILGATFVFRLLYGLFWMQPMNKAAKTASESSSSLSGKVIDSITNFTIIKLFAGAKVERTHLVGARKTAIRDRIYAQFIQRVFWVVPDVVWDLAYIGVLGLCVHLFIQGQIKVSDIVFTTSIFFGVMGAISRITSSIPNLVDVIGSAQQSYKELVKPIDIVDAPGARTWSCQMVRYR